MKINNEYPKVRAYIKKKYPEVDDGEITKLFCDIPPNTPQPIVLMIFKACESEVAKRVKESKPQ